MPKPKDNTELANNVILNDMFDESGLLTAFKKEILKPLNIQYDDRFILAVPKMNRRQFVIFTMRNNDNSIIIKYILNPNTGIPSENSEIQNPLKESTRILFVETVHEFLTMTDK